MRKLHACASFGDLCYNMQYSYIDILYIVTIIVSSLHVASYVACS